MNRITHFKTAEMEKNSYKEEITVVLLPLKSYFSWRLQREEWRERWPLSNFVQITQLSIFIWIKSGLIQRWSPGVWQ